MSLSVWIRVIRLKFLLASVIAVSLGLAISWNITNEFNAIHAVLTMIGVVSLHVSVDLLNDYWDFKRGIDTNTQRTKMSGGTGVLPEGLLKPSEVYKAGIGFLIFGGIIGGFFVFTFGITIAIILLFAILSIYFYSTKLVNWGLAEVFVAIKGTMIVLGTFYIQTNQILEIPIFAGIVVGVLSASVLFITSFPDHDADKQKGRRTLVILFGREKASLAYWGFPIIVYSIIFIFVITEYFPVYTLLTLFAIPLVVKSGMKLKSVYADTKKMIQPMSATISFSRICGVLLVLGFLINP
jgi:1,4-dihydroxy-2-naphthoate octaprenyltransferase